MRLWRIAHIRARGRLTSDDEQYYLVRERVEYISGVPAQSAECAELMQLLQGYEERLHRQERK